MKKPVHTALRGLVEGNAYTDIEDHSNASEAWYLLEENFKPRGSGFLNGAMEKLFFLTLSECKDAADYVTKFRATVTELKSFSTKFQMDENLLIFLFQYNLSASHSAYCQSCAQEHDPFGLDGTAKYTLSYAMHHFQNTVANPSKNPERSLVSLAAMGPSASQDSPTQQNSVQAGAQIGTSNARVISLRKTVKYCTHCKKDYHSVDECRVKYPHLIPTSSSPKPASKRRREGGNTNKKADEAKDDDTAYFAGGIKIGTTGVIAKFMSSNLYLITTLPQTTPFFSAYKALNPHTVDMWHSRLGHLGKQNVVKLAGMSDGMDLSLPPPSDACIPCARGTLQVETHTDAPIPGQARPRFGT